MCKNKKKTIKKAFASAENTKLAFNKKINAALKVKFSKKEVTYLNKDYEI